MEITKSVLSYEKISDTDTKMPVIIVAAGSSERMKGVNKQFAEIKGVPVIARTILKFQNSPLINAIIVVTKKDDISSVQALCEEYKLSKVTDIVSGGENRTASVKCGLERLDKGEKNVLIHDGARPFVTEKTIKDVASALKTSDCAIAAIKAVDTIKETDNDLMIVKTIDRDKVYLAATPQGVNVAKYRFALNSLKNKNFTDDASIMEAMGYKCVICECGRSNIKITTPEDLLIAEVFAGIEEESR